MRKPNVEQRPASGMIGAYGIDDAVKHFGGIERNQPALVCELFERWALGGNVPPRPLELALLGTLDDAAEVVGRVNEVRARLGQPELVPPLSARDALAELLDIVGEDAFGAAIRRGRRLGAGPELGDDELARFLSFLRELGFVGAEGEASETVPVLVAIGMAARWEVETQPGTGAVLVATNRPETRAKVVEALRGSTPASEAIGLVVERSRASKGTRGRWKLQGRSGAIAAAIERLEAHARTRGGTPEKAGRALAYVLLLVGLDRLPAIGGDSMPEGRERVDALTERLRDLARPRAGRYRSRQP